MHSSIDWELISFLIFFLSWDSIKLRESKASILYFFFFCYISYCLLEKYLSALRIRWLKYWSFSFNISPSNEHPRLISFRMDWLDLLVVQGTLTSLLQHHSSKASILLSSAFFIVQLSHPYMTTGKTIALTRWTFDKVMSLLFTQS